MVGEARSEKGLLRWRCAAAEGEEEEDFERDENGDKEDDEEGVCGELREEVREDFKGRPGSRIDAGVRYLSISQ